MELSALRVFFAKRGNESRQERLRRRIAGAPGEPPSGSGQGGWAAAHGPGGEGLGTRAVDVEVQVPHALILLAETPGPGLAKTYSSRAENPTPGIELNGRPAAAMHV